jgi:hypothetical protein
MWWNNVASSIENTNSSIIDPESWNWEISTWEAIRPYRSVCDIVDETKEIVEKLQNHGVFYGSPAELEHLLEWPYKMFGPKYTALKRNAISHIKNNIKWHEDRFSINLSSWSTNQRLYKVFFIIKEWSIFLLNKKILQEISAIKHPLITKTFNSK